MTGFRLKATIHDTVTGFPPGLEKWETIFQSGKSQGIFIRLEKLGKSQEFYQKFGKLEETY